MDREYKTNLLGKYVKFMVGKKRIIGRVISIEQGIANIRGVKQNKFTKNLYHVEYKEPKILTHEEVFKLGQNN